MKEINVTGQKRTDLGKKASKTLRKEGLIPCNLYGEKRGENGAPRLCHSQFHSLSCVKSSTLLMYTLSTSSSTVRATLLS